MWRLVSATAVVVRNELPSGRIEIAIQPTYILGAPTRIDVSIVATRGTVTGPGQCVRAPAGIRID